MITTDRDVFVGAHLTREKKEMLRTEAERRKSSMSLLVSDIIDEWLETAGAEKIEPSRSNKRTPVSTEEDVPLPFTPEAPESNA